MTYINSTGVNNVVTLVAIALTIISWIINGFQWWHNKKLAKRVTAMELLAYIDRFHYTYIKIKERTVKKTWYKGTQGAEMAHELSDVLSDYNRYRNLFTGDEKKSIDSKYEEANKLFHSFFGENQEYIDQMLLNLNLADQDLQNKKIKVQGYLGKL